MKNIFTNDLIKIETNKKIINKLNEEYEKGHINIENILDLFEDEQEIVNYLSEIMSYDFEISDVDKCIEDILVTYRKELLTKQRNEILKKLENARNQNLTNEEIVNLESDLNNIIIKLAKIK